MNSLTRSSNLNWTAKIKVTSNFTFTSSFLKLGILLIVMTTSLTLCRFYYICSLLYRIKNISDNVKKKLIFFRKMWQIECETVIKKLFEWMKMIANLKKHTDHLHILMSCTPKRSCRRHREEGRRGVWTALSRLFGGAFFYFSVNR